VDDFKLKRIQGLFRQLMLGPAAVRRRNADRLEKLLLELDPVRLYPYEFIYFRITGVRLKDGPREAYGGGEILPDLLQGLRSLSSSVPRDASESAERVYTDADIASRLHVSARTVRRWWRRGLAAAAYVFPEGRTRLAVRETVLNSFLEKNRRLAGRSKRFSRLSRSEGNQILVLARRYAAEGLRLTAAAGRVARELGRARETVRSALLRHDRDQPDRAIFAASAGRVAEDARRRIYSDYRQGIPVSALRARYGRSRASIYRIINQARAAEVLGEPFTYYEEDRFADNDAELRILGEEFQAAMQRVQGLHGSQKAPASATPEPLLWRGSPLARNDEAALFRAYNYAKWRADELRRELNPKRYISSQLLDDISRLCARAELLRECLIRTYMPLAEQVAKQHASGQARLAMLVALGHAHLGRLIQSFDYRGRGRFAEHARLELMKTFAQVAKEPADPERPHSQRPA
jgi:transposase